MQAALDKSNVSTQTTGVKPSSAQQAIAKGLTEEQYVKGQPKLYHAGTTDIAEVNMRKSNFQGTFYMSDNPTYAKSFGGNKSTLNEITLDKGAKMADLRNPSQDIVSAIEAKIAAKPTGKVIEITRPDGSILKLPEVRSGKINAVHSSSAILKGIRDGKAYFAEMPEVKAALKELGYDGMITQESKFGANYGVWNKDVLKTTSQLRTEYQAAKGEVKTATPSKPQQPAGLFDSTFYRGEGGTNKFQGKSDYIKGKMFATDASRAKEFGNVKEYQLKPGAKILEIDANGKSLDDLAKELNVTLSEFMQPTKLREILSSRGYDAVITTQRRGINGKILPESPVDTDLIELTDNALVPR